MPESTSSQHSPGRIPAQGNDQPTTPACADRQTSAGRAAGPWSTTSSATTARAADDDPRARRSAAAGWPPRTSAPRLPHSSRRPARLNALLLRARSAHGPSGSDRRPCAKGLRSSRCWQVVAGLGRTSPASSSPSTTTSTSAHQTPNPSPDATPMFVPRSLSKKNLAAKARPTAAASGGGSGQASLSPAPPAPTASGPSTPSSSSSTTAVPLAAPPAASSSSNSSALPAQPPTADPPAPASKAEAKAAAAARRRTARVARELALMLALVLSDHALSTDDSGLELGKWLSRLHCACSTSSSPPTSPLCSRRLTPPLSLARPPRRPAAEHAPQAPVLLPPPLAPPAARRAGQSDPPARALSLRAPGARRAEELWRVARPARGQRRARGRARVGRLAGRRASDGRRAAREDGLRRAFAGPSWILHAASRAWADRKLTRAISPPPDDPLPGPRSHPHRSTSQRSSTRPSRSSPSSPPSALPRAPSSASATRRTATARPSRSTLPPARRGSPTCGAGRGRRTGRGASVQL